MLRLNKDTLLLEASLAAVFITGQRLHKKLHLPNPTGPTGYSPTWIHMVLLPPTGLTLLWKRENTAPSLKQTLQGRSYSTKSSRRVWTTLSDTWSDFWGRLCRARSWSQWSWWAPFSSGYSMILYHGSLRNAVYSETVKNLHSWA